MAENLKRGGVWVPPWVTERLARFQPPLTDSAAPRFDRPPAAGEHEVDRSSRHAAGR